MIHSKNELKKLLETASSEVDDLAQQHTGVSPVKKGKMPKEDEIVTEWLAKMSEIEEMRQEAESQKA